MSRSASIVWLLEELDVQYETKIVDFRRADGTGSRDPANPHPHGKVPALKDGEETIFEGCAIALFLTDKYPAKKMGPRVGEPKPGLPTGPASWSLRSSRAASISNMYTARWDGLQLMRWKRC